MKGKFSRENFEQTDKERLHRKIRKGEKLGKVSKYENGDGAGGCGYRMPLISLDKNAKLGFHIATCLRLIKKITCHHEKS